MFKRILHDDWAHLIPFVSFFLIFGVFVVATIRALLLSKERRDHLASLPLEDASQESHPPRQP